MKNCKRLLCLLLAAIMLLSLCGCCLKHEYSEASCTEPATCAVCGKTKGEPLGHDPKPMEDKEPTCTEDGSKGGEICSRCGEILTAPDTVPALGHDSVIDEKIPATAESSGKTEGSHCSRCGEVLEEQKDIVLTEDEQIYAQALGFLNNNEYDESFKLLKDYSDSDNPQLKGLLGAHYYLAWGVGENNRQAFKLFSEAAESGYPYAELLLANCYQFGYGTSKKEDLAEEWDVKALADMEKLAEKSDILEERAFIGNVFGQMCMSKIHHNEPDIDKAFSALSEAAVNGSSTALFELGVCYFNGLGTEKNRDEAFRCFSELENKKDPDALTMLSLMYKYGLGCEADAEKCAELRAEAKALHQANVLCGEKDYYLYYSEHEATFYYTSYNPEYDD